MVDARTVLVRASDDPRVSPTKSDGFLITTVQIRYEITFSGFTRLTFSIHEQAGRFGLVLMLHMYYMLIYGRNITVVEVKFVI